MRSFFLTLLLLLFSSGVLAVEAPAGQIPIKPGDILRGRFVQEIHMSGMDKPMQSSGHFTVAPGHGLIWGIEMPMATTSVITPGGSMQDFGGVSVKLRIKNLRHLYAIVGGALAGDWSGLETDYLITRSNKDGQWQMQLTPRPNIQSTVPYTSITVTGGRYVENIVMMKRGGADTFSFTDETLARAPLTGDENVAFNKAAR